MRELKSIIILTISILTFILLLPFVIVVSILRILRSILKITEETITYLMESIRNEILKQ
mgnify:CR=1 FL=1